jgi:hypothetical protein
MNPVTSKERGATILMPSSMVDSLNPTAATLGFALAGNGTFSDNNSPENKVAPVSRGVPAANGALEPDSLPHPAAA